MTIEGGTAMVLAYVLVSIGVIVAFLCANGGANAALDGAAKSITTGAGRGARARGARKPAAGRSGWFMILDRRPEGRAPFKGASRCRLSHANRSGTLRTVREYFRRSSRLRAYCGLNRRA